MPLKITNVQDFTLHDGPGIRTTLFLSGCPLRCAWCHNPETWEQEGILIFDAERCTVCGRCGLCENGVHTFEKTHGVHREKCILCGECVSACPTGALALSTRELSDGDYARIVERQLRIAGKEGGITFSGGEPLMQGRELIRLMKAYPVHTAIETCGYADAELFEEVVGAADYVMLDLKLASDELHRKYTGVSNAPILRNLDILRKSRTPFVLRTPLIPNITDTDENLSELKKIVGGDTWERLEYNVLTPVKYARIGRSLSALGPTSL